MDICPDCGHAKPEHSPVVGCLAGGLADPCDCDRRFPQAAKTPATAQAETTEAVERVERGTDDDWAKAATEALTYLARTSTEPFSTDDAWVLLEEMEVPPPREPRAMGPVVRRLTAAHVLKADGYAASVRRHQTPVRTYTGGTAARA